MKTLTLRKDSADQFDIIIPEADVDFDAADVRGLSDGQILALASRAIADFSYRAGAKKDNANKEFTLAEIATYLIEVGTRTGDGEPSELDKTMASKILAAFTAAFLKANPAPKKPGKDAKPEELEAYKAACKEHEELLREYLYAETYAKAIRNGKAEGYEYSEPPTEKRKDAEGKEVEVYTLTPHLYCATWHRFHRLFKARKAKQLL